MLEELALEGRSDEQARFRAELADAVRLPTAGKRALAELLRELTRGAPLLEFLDVGPAGWEIAYASSHELLVAYRVDHEQRLVPVLSLVWLDDPG